MSDYFTGAGDDGSTGLLGEGRVSKADARPETYGTLDEASAALGWARSQTTDAAHAEILITVQRDLYGMMSEVAATPENAARFRSIDDSRLEWLEVQLQQVGGQVAMPDEFVLFGESGAAAACDLARTIVRRAERRLVALSDSGELDNPVLIQYLNRLSSMLFVMALHENTRAGIREPAKARPKR